MFCPNCGAQNTVDAKFCNQCGTNLAEAINYIEEPARNQDLQNQTRNVESNEDEVYNGQSTSNLDLTYSNTDTETNKIKDLDDDKLENKTENTQIQCIICKTGIMVQTIHTGTFGIGTRKMLICDHCGAVFEEKGHKYKFSKISDTNQPLWLKYGHQTLTENEWDRIGDGGVSDVEQHKIDTEKLAIERQETEMQKQRDANDFLVGLQNGTIPIKYSGTSPVILKKDETISIIMENIKLQEPRAVRQTHAAYGGPTIRVAKGVSFRLGGASARSESHDEIKLIDQGKLVLTNKRLIFIGTKRTINIDLRKIMAIEAYKDGIESQRENKQKPEYFIGTDNHTVTFNINGRSNSTPVYGNVLKAAIQGAITQL